MNEEEKKAVENIKELKTLFEIDDKKDFEATPLVQKEIAKDLKTLLNLIEKLQKENKSLKQEITVLQNTKDTCPEFNSSGVRCSLKQENKELKETNEDLRKSVDQIYDDYQDIGKMAFDYSDKIEEQDRIIDLMASEILALDIKRADSTYDKARIWETEKGTKQYFENKAKKEE